MARTRNRLSARQASTLTEPGMYADGGNLYLQVSRWGTKSWVFRYRRGGKAHDMGLGSAEDVSLKRARERAQEYRLMLIDGLDPLDQRRKGELRARLEDARSLTFRDCAERYIATNEAGWRNEKHGKQWHATLQAYAYPIIGDIPVADVDTGLVMRVLEPIWAEKTETATRVRGRIERILSWATVQQYREGDNPARWRGHLDHLLPKPGKVKRSRHHAALPYTEVGEFMGELREQEGNAARALEFAILTAARTSEVLNATWAEIDRKRKLWTVPAERMKAGEPHTVPLCDQAVAVLNSMRDEDEPDGYIFPGAKERKPLSNMAMIAVLRRMGRSDITVHGFRSTFRDWAAEQTAYPAEVAEMALAHIVGDKTQQAYLRAKLLPKRQRMMRDWCRHCAKAVTAAVVPLRQGSKGG
ncbi:tyrosine-type recombinase/integrase [Lentisalinibacter orientalis]|uniref:tyrosine-type recombinase/integrase n=1 Tax=Lentisalinibacter orientalis TaxID=2992241 RepID=UPI00386E89FA